MLYFEDNETGAKHDRACFTSLFESVTVTISLRTSLYFSLTAIAFKLFFFTFQRDKIRVLLCRVEAFMKSSGKCKIGDVFPKMMPRIFDKYLAKVLDILVRESIERY
jgi:hypothetical protein